jgi:type IV pilus assembly protein PilM
MNMIFRRAESLVGLDIGSSAVKAVTLRRTSRGREVLAVGSEPMPRGSIVDGDVVDRDVVAEVIGQAFDRNGIRTRRVATAVSGNAVIVKKVTLPLMDEDDLAESIRWEAEQYIPFDIKDVNLDYQLLQAGSDAENRASMDVLLVAAKTEKIADYADVISRAGGVPVVVDIAAFALQNAFEVNYGIDAGRVTMLVNAGASGMNINIVEGGQSLFTRDISIGGDAYTEALQSELGLSYEDAERLKRGQPAGGAGPEDADPITGTITEHLLLEIEKTFAFFQATAVRDRIDELVVSGGSAAVRGFFPALETRFDVPVSPFDPFRRIVCDPEKGGGEGNREPGSAVAVSSRGSRTGSTT